MGSRGSSFSGAVVPELAVGEEQRVPRASNALSALLARAPLALGIVTLAAAYYGAAKIGYALEFSGPVARGRLAAGRSRDLVSSSAASGSGRACCSATSSPTTTARCPWPRRSGRRPATCSRSSWPCCSCIAWSRSASPLASVRGVTRMLVAIAAGAAISATIGPLSLLLGGVLAADSLPTVWRTWWLGDFSGGLVVVPLALAWWPPRPLAVRARIVEAIVLLLALAATGEITSRSEGPWAYLCFCALIWAGASLRHERRNPRDRGRRRVHRLEHDALRRAVRLALAVGRCPGDAALHRRGRGHDVVPGSRRVRAGADRRAARVPPARA